MWAGVRCEMRDRERRIGVVVYVFGVSKGVTRIEDVCREGAEACLEVYWYGGV
jgi:hypothetical protein